MSGPCTFLPMFWFLTCAPFCLLEPIHGVVLRSLTRMNFRDHIMQACAVLFGFGPGPVLCCLSVWPTRNSGWGSCMLAPFLVCVCVVVISCIRLLGYCHRLGDALADSCTGICTLFITPPLVQFSSHQWVLFSSLLVLIGPCHRASTAKPEEKKQIFVRLGGQKARSSEIHAVPSGGKVMDSN